MLLPVYLASASPRRRQLMDQIGLNFMVIKCNVDESFEDSYSPAEVVQVLSERKARKVAGELDYGLVIGSDTVVVCRDCILGKPRDKEEAMEMLTFLQGDEHSVYSGLAVIDAKTGEAHVSHERTRVFFRPAERDELERYVDTGEPMDKAGAYAIQGIGAIFVKRIEGCYFNVVGLPLPRLVLVLKQFGLDVLKNQ